jgi:hypothetical protein
MNRFQMLTAATVLAVAMGVPGIVAAGGGGDESPTTTDATIKFINPKLGIIQLTDGTEIRVRDPQQLQGLKGGDHVHLMYEEMNGRDFLIFITKKKDE